MYALGIKMLKKAILEDWGTAPKDFIAFYPRWPKRGFLEKMRTLSSLYAEQPAQSALEQARRERLADPRLKSRARNKTCQRLITPDVVSALMILENSKFAKKPSAPLSTEEPKSKTLIGSDRWSDPPDHTTSKEVSSKTLKMSLLNQEIIENWGRAPEDFVKDCPVEPRVSFLEKMKF